MLTWLGSLAVNILMKAVVFSLSMFHLQYRQRYLLSTLSFFNTWIGFQSQFKKLVNGSSQQSPSPMESNTFQVLATIKSEDSTKIRATKSVHLMVWLAHSLVTNQIFHHYRLWPPLTPNTNVLQVNSLQSSTTQEVEQLSQIMGSHVKLPRIHTQQATQHATGNKPNSLPLSLIMVKLTVLTMDTM